MADAPSMAELLGEDTPKNWGKWGPDDQVGCLNYLDASQVLRGYTAAPLKIHEATGAPVDPVVIR